MTATQERTALPEVGTPMRREHGDLVGIGSQFNYAQSVTYTLTEDGWVRSSSGDSGVPHSTLAALMSAYGLPSGGRSYLWSAVVPRVQSALPAVGAAVRFTHDGIVGIGSRFTYRGNGTTYTLTEEGWERRSRGAAQTYPHMAAIRTAGRTALGTTDRYTWTVVVPRVHGLIGQRPTREQVDAAGIGSEIHMGIVHYRRTSESEWVRTAADEAPRTFSHGHLASFVTGGDSYLWAVYISRSARWVVGQEVAGEELRALPVGAEVGAISGSPALRRVTNDHWRAINGVRRYAAANVIAARVITALPAEAVADESVASEWAVGQVTTDYARLPVGSVVSISGDTHGLTKTAPNEWRGIGAGEGIGPYTDEGLTVARRIVTVGTGSWSAEPEAAVEIPMAVEIPPRTWGRWTVGDTVEGREYEELPVGTVVRDENGEERRKISATHWQRADGRGGTWLNRLLIDPRTITELPEQAVEEAVEPEPVESMVGRRVTLADADRCLPGSIFRRISNTERTYVRSESGWHRTRNGAAGSGAAAHSLRDVMTPGNYNDIQRGESYEWVTFVGATAPEQQHQQEEESMESPFTIGQIVTAEVFRRLPVGSRVVFATANTFEERRARIGHTGTAGRGGWEAITKEAEDRYVHAGSYDQTGAYADPDRIPSIRPSGVDQDALAWRLDQIGAEQPQFTIGQVVNADTFRQLPVGSRVLFVSPERFEEVRARIGTVRGAGWETVTKEAEDRYIHDSSNGMTPNPYNSPDRIPCITYNDGTVWRLERIGPDTITPAEVAPAETFAIAQVVNADTFRRLPVGSRVVFSSENSFEERRALIGAVRGGAWEAVTKEAEGLYTHQRSGGYDDRYVTPEQIPSIRDIGDSGYYAWRLDRIGPEAVADVAPEEAFVLGAPVDRAIVERLPIGSRILWWDGAVEAGRERIGQTGRPHWELVTKESATVYAHTGRGQTTPTVRNSAASIPCLDEVAGGRLRHRWILERVGPEQPVIPENLRVGTSIETLAQIQALPVGSMLESREHMFYVKVGAHDWDNCDREGVSRSRHGGDRDFSLNNYNTIYRYGPAVMAVDAIPENLRVGTSIVSSQQIRDLPVGSMLEWRRADRTRRHYVKTGETNRWFHCTADGTREREYGNGDSFSLGGVNFVHRYGPAGTAAAAARVLNAKRLVRAQVERIVRDQGNGDASQGAWWKLGVDPLPEVGAQVVGGSLFGLPAGTLVAYSYGTGPRRAYAVLRVVGEMASTYTGFAEVVTEIHGSATRAQNSVQRDVQYTILAIPEWTPPTYRGRNHFVHETWVLLDQLHNTFSWCGVEQRLLREGGFSDPGDAPDPEEVAVVAAPVAPAPDASPVAGLGAGSVVSAGGRTLVLAQSGAWYDAITLAAVAVPGGAVTVMVRGSDPITEPF